MNTKLKLVRSVTWEEVFSMWGKEEADLPHWIEHYKERGFNSWEEWRKSSVNDLQLENLTWNLYEILEPLETVPKFYAGPFRAWMKKYYDGEKTITFERLAKNPGVIADSNLNELLWKFPKSSVLIGLIKDDTVTIIEGLHRCSALAVAKEKGIAVETKIFIACAKFSGDMPILGQENSPT